MTHRERVLFLCTHNAARSQMAEALLRLIAGDRFEVSSAGLEPTEVHPLTREVLSERGIDTSVLRAKGIREFIGQARVNYAIVVCEPTEPSCPRVFPFALQTLHWPFPDPASMVGTLEAQRTVFRRVRECRRGLRSALSKNGASRRVSAVTGNKAAYIPSSWPCST